MHAILEYQMIRVQILTTDLHVQSNGFHII